MKQRLALFCAFLALAVLIPLAGCGGSGSDEYYPQGLSVVDSGGTRGIRVSWTRYPDSQFTVLEYQIVRWSPSDAVPTYTVVGVVGSQSNTFVDTIQTHTVTYNGLISVGGSPTLVQATRTALGLTPGSYAYAVRALYRANSDTGAGTSYGTLNVLEPTAPISYR